MGTGDSYDIVILGAGVAGLYAALTFRPEYRVLVVSKEDVDVSNSYLAQGGIAAAIGKTDNTRYHLDDTLRVGGGICNVAAVEAMVAEAERSIHDLHRLGVSFDTESGELALTREGGHSRFRILHVDGDATGRGLVQALSLELAKRENIHFLKGFSMSLLMENGGCRGVRVLDDQREYRVYAPLTILATGGIGMAYGVTTNAPGATGDGIAMAWEAGAAIFSMEFIQFHPTVFYSEERRRFLISEAVRGEGALLRNQAGERFMPLVDSRAELAPRDVVSRAIDREIQKQNDPFVSLDATVIPAEHLRYRFPNIYARCLEYGKDMCREMIPVSPAQHYCIGGVATDLHGQTTIKHLYAIGESACTGVHGANRLASNSLLEAVVFAKRAAVHIMGSLPPGTGSGPVQRKDRAPAKEPDHTASLQCLQETMWHDAGIVRTERGLQRAQKQIGAIAEALGGDPDTRATREMHNLLRVSSLIVEAARQRKESIGTHYLEEDHGYDRSTKGY